MDNVVSLNDLFQRRLFRVPDYQRGYSWEEQQVQEFLEDLKLLGHDRYHYTGTVVLHKMASEGRMDEDGNHHDLVEIVDGQQRLTTIVLLLDSICRSLDGFSDASKKLARGIRKNYIVAKEQNGQKLFKVSLNNDTNHFFVESILSDRQGVEGPQITSEQRLDKAKEQISNYIVSNVNANLGDGESWLTALYNKVVTKLRFTLYQVEKAAEVGVIFEVMNDRGKPLTELEKVKNYLLHTSNSLSIENDLANTVNGAWAEILRQLMAAGLVSSADEDRLLRAHWLAYYNPQSRLWNGSKSIKEEFALRRYEGKHKSILERLHQYTEGVRASCICFCDAYQPNRKDAFESFRADPSARKKVTEWSAKLVRVGYIATFLPLLLAIRGRWPDSPEKYLDALKICEAFAFRVYSWKQYKSNTRQQKIFDCGYKLANQELSFMGAMKILKAELAKLCSDDEFKKETTLDSPGDYWYQWRGLRYFLYEYETTLSSKQGASPKVTWDELRNSDRRDTIEHVLPQSIDGIRYWKAKFNPTKHEQYVHDLGNLTLTKHNSHYQNKPFPEKKGSHNAKIPCYTTSPLYVERDLVRWNTWNASAIDARRTELLDWARTRWAVDLSGLENIERESETVEDEVDEDNEVDLDDDEA